MISLPVDCAWSHIRSKVWPYSESLSLGSSGDGSAGTLAFDDSVVVVVVVVECRICATFAAAAWKSMLRGAGSPVALFLEPQSDEHHVATEVRKPPSLA